MTFLSILQTENVVYLIGLYSFNTLYSTFVYSIIPLWLTSPFNEGGLNMEVDEVANIYLGIGIPLFLFQIIMYPLISKKMKQLNILKSGLFISIPVWIMIPLTGVIANGAMSFYVKAFLILTIFLRVCCGFFVSSSL
jgi:hypothetical protein